MDEIKIETGIPIVPIKRSRADKYPWAGMKVGDSFFVATNKIPARLTSTKAAGLRYNMKFTTRAGDGGVRVWRVK